MKILPPHLDLVFKKLVIEAPDIIVPSLAYSFGAIPPNAKIIKIELKDTELFPQGSAVEKSSSGKKESFWKSYRVDAHLVIEYEDENGQLQRKKIHFELQAFSDDDFFNRYFSYTLRLADKEYKKGELFDTFTPLFSLAICKYNLKELANRPFFYNSFGILFTTPPHDMVTDRIAWGVVELSKMKQKDITKLSGEEQWWAYFFKYAAEMSEREQDFFKTNAPEVIKMAYKKLEEFSNDSDFASWAIKREEDIAAIEQNKLFERREGERVGEARGIKKGEAKVRLEMAIGLLKEGADRELVARVAKLSKKEVAKLEEEIKHSKKGQ